MPRYWLMLLCSLFTCMVSANDMFEVSHFQGHSRYAYGEKLLKLALSKVSNNYALKGFQPNNEPLNEARGELEVIEGIVDIEWMSTTLYRESNMIAIKIPIYRGMLGLRLLLVNKKEHQVLSKLSSLKELQTLTGGHGLHWKDLTIYHANMLPVVAHKSYDRIFDLLKLNRIDYFHRGLNEIWGEFETHNDTLKIADNIMLYYPLPVYFFVSKHNPILAKMLQKGLELALEDGSFEALFKEETRSYIEKAELGSRRLIKLRNPDLPPDTPQIDTGWWLPHHLATTEAMTELPNDAK